MMPLSRRQFLGIAATVPLALPQGRSGTGTNLRLDPPPPHCLLIDAGEQCALQESLTGFARGLVAASIPFERVSAETLTFTSRPGPESAGPQVLIVPGAVMDSPDFAKKIRRLTDVGSTVIYESGVAFARPEVFKTEQRLLRDYFGLSLQAPQELWAVKRDVGRTPYVRYHWPAQAMVRDFSRVVAVSTEGASTAHMAHIGTTAVGCYHPLGKGAFIFLGSPLGPHVGFGDAEARQLLIAFVRPFSQSEIQPPIHELPTSS
jgi:hypothetical protein